jgi:hypothetical protein
MAKRDPEKTARNKEIAELTDKLRTMLPAVLKQTGYKAEANINAVIGSKSDLFIDLRHEVINSSEEFIQLWLQGLKTEADVDRLYRPSVSRPCTNPLRGIGAFGGLRSIRAGVIA